MDYDAATHSLFVQFTSGEWYAYLDVPSARYAGILASTSKGRFFQEMIRDRYDYVRLDVSPSP